VDGGGQCPDINTNGVFYFENPGDVDACQTQLNNGMNSQWCSDFFNQPLNSYFNDECGCGCDGS
jgi:hypothetical protein